MRLLAASVVVAALAAVGVPGSVLANPPTTTWGWVTDRQPTVTDFTPAVRDQGNSQGMTNTVHRAGTGVYQVVMPQLASASNGGTVILTALGTAPRFCAQGDIGRIGSDESLYVSCYDFSGQPRDSKFSMVYSAGGSQTGTQAYLWANDPSSGSYTPDLFYQFNSTNVDNTIARSAAGTYSVTLPGMNGTEGNIQVTTQVDGGNCRITGWSKVTPTVVGVTCYALTSATPTDARFDLMYTDLVGMTGVSASAAAYLYANKPTTALYTPAPAYRFSTAMAPSIKRTGTGAYIVKLPGMPRGGAASVTAVGNGKSRCQLSGISTVTPQKVGVLCFSPSGSPVDARFTFSYVK